MKKLSLIVILILTAAMLVAANGIIKLQDNPAKIKLQEKSKSGLSVSYAMNKLQFQEVNTKEGIFTELNSLDYTSTNTTGMPALPLMRKLISVPLGASVTVNLSNIESKTLNLDQYGVYYPLMPRQESVSKSANLEQLPFEVNRNFYNSNTWTDNPSISVTELGMMRGIRIFALDFVPVKYNPALKQIEVIYNAEVNVSFNGGDYSATNTLQQKTFSPVFENVFAGTILNYEPQRTSLLRYPIGYVIILPDNFITPMQSFINWKKQEGYNVIVAPTSVTGTSATAIKTYMQNMWNAATTENPAPSYLLIVGDIAQVPTNSGSTGSHPTDLNYVRLQGTDYMPELYFGRFSATTVDEVTNQVNKTLMHEQYTMPSDAYLSEVVMIAGVDSNYGSSHANGQINYGTTNYFNTAHNITSHTYLYPGSGSSESAIVQNLSNGVGYANYTAHGDVTYWYDPNITISNVNSLQNTNKYSFVVGNCCLTSKFDSAICFAEAWLRATNKGAVVYIGGTNSTYWDEDYYWGVGYKPPIVGTGSPFVAGHTGAYDAVFHDHSEPFADWAGNAGSMVVMGNLAVVQANSSRINYYWEIYSIMGDPSLVPYLGIPAQNSYVPPAQMFLGLNSMDIQADPNSYVALSMNDELHGVGLTDATGHLTLNYTPFDEPGLAKLVITRSLRKPLITNIEVIPNEGPFVTAGTLEINDNNNNVAEAGDNINISMQFNNVGIEAATNLTATLTCDSPWIVLNNATVQLPDLAAGESYTQNNAFNISILPEVPDQHTATFVITVSNGETSWEVQRNLIINAPNVVFGNHTLFDTDFDGIYEPGEAISVSMTISNTGHMNVQGGSLTVVLNSPYLTSDIYNFTIPSLSVGNGIPLNFHLFIDADCPNGEIIPVGFALDAGVQMLNHSIQIPIGIIGESFESGTFTAMPWVNTSSSPWTIVEGAANVHKGNYSVKSGAIGNNSSTTLQITMNVTENSNMSFWLKVSSEADYDFLKFYIDSTETGSWSGSVNWTEVSYPVTAGNHTFKWTYSKDVSTVSGSDCAWLDDILFPGMGVLNTAIFYSTTQQIDFNDVIPNETVSSDFTIRNLGNIAMQGIIYTPTEFTLYQNGAVLPNEFTYQIGSEQTMRFTLNYTAGSSVHEIHTAISIVTNDPNQPTVTIPVNLVPLSNVDVNVIPIVTALHRNYPNPFNPETSIKYSLSVAGPVKLDIYNIKGQLVRRMVDEHKTAGNYTVVWNGKDEQGKNVSSGIYFYRMQTTNYSSTHKMMLMK
ncbi:MAG: C25 family cysteine peptidase [Candidatus Cloacimonas sp.]